MLAAARRGRPSAGPARPRHVPAARRSGASPAAPAPAHARRPGSRDGVTGDLGSGDVRQRESRQRSDQRRVRRRQRRRRLDDQSRECVAAAPRRPPGACIDRARGRAGDAGRSLRPRVRSASTASRIGARAPHAIAAVAQRVAEAARSRRAGCAAPRARGNTLKVISTTTPSVRALPTSSVVQQEPGGVLHDLAAAADEPALAVDEPRADDEVAHAAVAVAAGAAQPGGHRAADGGARRRASGGSNGRYCPCSRQRGARCRATGVPASAVNMHSAGWYSTMPVRPAQVERTASVAGAAQAGLVPPPRTASAAPGPQSCPHLGPRGVADAAHDGTRPPSAVQAVAAVAAVSGRASCRGWRCSRGSIAWLQALHAARCPRRRTSRQEVALLEADAVLAGDRPAERDAQPQDVGGQRFGALERAGLAAVEEDERVQVAVAGVEHVGDADAVLARDSSLDADQRLAQPRCAARRRPGR